MIPLLLISLSVLQITECKPCHDAVPNICNDLLNHGVGTSTEKKCLMWAALIRPSLITSTQLTPSQKLRTVGELCPKSCGMCDEPTTTTTARPTTTTQKISEEQEFELIMTDESFKKVMEEAGRQEGISPQEGIERYALYSKNSEKISSHNRMFDVGLSTFRQGVNKFAVLKEEELTPNTLKPPPMTIATELPKLRKKRSGEEERNSVDWREYMHPIQDQAECGGCWAFAMTAMLEGTMAMKNISKEKLSVQQMLDCDRERNAQYKLANAGCNGGYFQIAGDYLTRKALVAGANYTFAGYSKGVCRRSQFSPVAPRMSAFDSGYVVASTDESKAILDQAMEARVRRGPVAVGMAVVDEIYRYSEGIYDGQCGSIINHAVVLVGFTREYWIIRNSWGSDWGEAGHIRIRRQPSDPCMLTSYYAQLETIGQWEVAAVVRPHVNVAVSPPASVEGSGCGCDGCCEESCDCDDEDDEDYWVEEESSSTETYTAFTSTTTTTTTTKSSKPTSTSTTLTTPTKKTAAPKKTPKPKHNKKKKGHHDNRHA